MSSSRYISSVIEFIIISVISANDVDVTNIVLIFLIVSL